jgi:hypothetical protein
LCLVIVSGIAACAPTGGAAPAQPATTPSAATTGGTILWVRNVVAPDKDNSWRALLVNNAVASPATADSEAAPLMEFIVRTDNGATLSVVQTNAIGLRPGDRVVILRDATTHLGRPAAAEQRAANQS